MGYKTIDELMVHLNKNNISISGDLQKRQLINTGYFHGYKGYRFFKKSNIRLPFISFNEIYATIQYDSQLKSLFYDKIMFIETAIKNIALICILRTAGSESIQDLYANIVNSYKNAPSNTSPEQKKNYQKNKLSLQSTIQSYLLNSYKSNNPKITHFYNNANYSDVPIWALLEIMTMGDFGFLLSCLTYTTRDDISRELGINLASDTNRELIYKYIYTIKDLRNAIAHNDVIFDTRFRKIDPTKAMKRCLEQEIGLPYVNFKTIEDYIILICYYLKLLQVPKSEILLFIESFERIISTYSTSVNKNVSAIVIHPDCTSKINILKSFI